MRKYVQQLMLLGGLLLACGQLQAQATLSVQGTIQRSTGAAVDDGDYDITFRLYTAPTGGSPVWSETQSGVEIIGGVYSVALGSVNPLNAPFDQTYYLGISVGTGVEHTPRTLLTSAPYALSLLGQDNKFPSTGMVKMEAVATGQATTTATSYAVTADDHVIFLDHTANQNITLPAATAANAGRHLVLVNKEAVAKTLTSSNYIDLAGATSTTVPATGVVELRSDGSVWRQTGGYIQPAAAVTKAYVNCRGASPLTLDGTYRVINYTEQADPQNCYSNGVFTAPRTGVYLVCGTFGTQDSAPGTWSNGSYMYAVAGGTCTAGQNAWFIGITDASSSHSGNFRILDYSTTIQMTAGQTFSLRATVTGSHPMDASTWHWMTITEL